MYSLCMVCHGSFYVLRFTVPAEFHAVFDLACPGLLGDLKAFNKMYEGPIQRGRDADATEKQVMLATERRTAVLDHLATSGNYSCRSGSQAARVQL